MSTEIDIWNKNVPRKPDVYIKSRHINRSWILTYILLFSGHARVHWENIYCTFYVLFHYFGQNIKKWTDIRCSFPCWPWTTAVIAIAVTKNLSWWLLHWQQWLKKRRKSENIVSGWKSYTRAEKQMEFRSWSQEWGCQIESVTSSKFSKYNKLFLYTMYIILAQLWCCLSDSLFSVIFSVKKILFIRFG